MDSLGFNHFVLLFQRDRRIEFVEIMLTKCWERKVKCMKRTASHIDLTSDESDGRGKVVDCENKELVDVKFMDNGTVCDMSDDDSENGKNIGNSSVDNIQEDGSVWKISCNTNDKCKSVPEKSVLAVIWVQRFLGFLILRIMI